MNAADPDQDGAAEPVRLSIAQAATLQSFPPDYPWRGTDTKILEQIGNAVPPLFAAAILRAALRSDRLRTSPGERLRATSPLRRPVTDITY